MPYDRHFAFCRQPHQPIDNEKLSNGQVYTKEDIFWESLDFLQKGITGKIVEFGWL